MSKVRNIFSKTIISILKKVEKEGMTKFDFIFIETFNLSLFEIEHSSKLSDKTCEALNQLLAFQLFEFYSGYEEIIANCLELGSIVKGYNDAFDNFNLGTLGTNNEDWITFLSNRIENVFEIS